MATKYFMTGVTGLVGSAVVVGLVRDKADCEFVCLVRSGGGQSAAARAEAALREECAFEGLPELTDEVLRRVSVIDGNLADLDVEAVAANPLMAGVNQVFHCAADVNLGKDPTGRVYRVNYEGTRNMVELAKRIGAQEFHFVATAYVAGKLEGTFYEKEPTLEYGFNNPYEESKCKAELLVRAAGIPFTVYRPAIIVGRSTDGRIRRALAFYRILEFLKALRDRKAARAGEDAEGFVDMRMNCRAVPSNCIYFTPIDYVQEAIVKLIRNPAKGVTYNVTGASPISVPQIWEAVRSVYRIKGITVGLDEDTGTAEERMFTKFVGDLFPYFSSQIVFDQTNIARDWPQCAQWSYGLEDLKKLVRAYLEENA